MFTSATLFEEEQFLESCAELFVEDGVDDGVGHRVDVAEPRGDGEENFRKWCERCDDVHCEEWRPTEQEDTHNHAKCSRRFVVASGLLRRRAEPRCRLLLLLDALDVALGEAVHGDVHEEHDEARNEEADEGGADRVHWVEVDETDERATRVVWLVVIRKLPPEVDGDEGDECGEEPHAEDEEEGATWRHNLAVVVRLADVEVSIEGDCADVEDGSRTTHHVQRHPNVAENCAEYPPALHVVDATERHDGDSDEEVGAGERHVEEVAALAERSLREDGDADERVSGDGAGDDDNEEGGC